MTIEDTKPRLQEMTYPVLFHAADEAAARGERETLALIGLGLGVLLVTAAAGVIEAQIAGLIGAASFFVAMMLRSYTLSTRPEGNWYNGRALAESVKTLTWRYSVGGNPFPIGTSSPDELFGQRLLDILHDVREVGLEPTTAGVDQITPEMRSLRALPLAERRDAYHQLRIQDQFDWYSSRSRQHSKRGRRIGVATVVFECAGGIFGLLGALDVVHVSLLGLFAAIAAALIAWERTRQDTTISRAYALAAQELGVIASLITNQGTEELWSTFVDHAEEAISREHTLWRASHS